MSDKIQMTALTHPFRSSKKRLEFDQGTTISDMLISAQPDVSKLRHAVVFINGKVIQKKHWNLHKPNAGELVEVRACPVPRGGGGGGGKDVGRLVLTIAVIALSVWAGGVLAGALGFTGTALQGLVATAGMLAVNALCPVTSSSIGALSSTETKDSDTLYIEGAKNSLDPFGTVPCVLGKHRQRPKQGSKPYTEIIGENQYFRMLLVWGIGPIEIDESSIKIGDTLLSEFEDYQIEHREGYADDADLTLFPDAISEESFSVAMTSAGSWVTRTTTISADEVSIDIAFPGGLVEYDANGNKGQRSINVEVEYRVSGSEDPWSKIDVSSEKFQTTFDAAWLNMTGDDLDSITFTAKKTSALRYGIRWGVSERAQYDVRVRRITADTDSSLIADLTYWTALRSIKVESPVNSPVPLAMTAIAIKATDQFNGLIDDLSAVVTRVCKDWDSASETWIIRASQNPASMFLFVLQGSGHVNPLGDSRIDLETLAEWHEFCTEKGYTFNQIRDYSSSVWDTLRDICAAGRAAPTMIDGRWSVVIDQEQDIPASVITPRNSFGFSAEKFFLDPPHGWRIQFPNEDQDYATDERRVYRDGYDDDNATRFETLSLVGVTDPDQIFKLGRWRIAQVMNQPERWTFKQDMEYLTYRRGDRIKIAHDVMIVGLKQGRIKSLVTDELTAVTSITLDEEVIMEAGKAYGVVIRTIDNPSLSAQVITSAGTSNTIVFSEPIDAIGSPAAQAVSIGDLVCFGEFGEEAEDATVISIVPDNNLHATVITVPYRPDIYDCDTEEIPAFVTTITAQDAIPEPEITAIVSDESAMVVSSTGTLKIRIGILFEPLNAAIFGTGNDIVVQIRTHGTNENYYPAVIEEQGTGYVYIGDVRSKDVIDIRLRWKVNGKLLPGPWVEIEEYTVIGRSSAPAPLANMTISAFGAQAMIRWDKPSELDVIYGGEVEFRHSNLMDGATWASSVNIGQSSFARTLFAVMPLKPGTYLARVYDVDGNPSETITMVTTKQVSLSSFASVITLDEAPYFLGAHDGTEVLSGSIKITDGASPDVMSGEYQFSQGIDLGSVKNVRLTTRIAVQIYDVNDTMDSRTENIDEWADFDSLVTTRMTSKIYVRNTDDDPSGSPVGWSSWERLESAEFNARAFQFYIRIEREDINYNILISELGIDVDEIE